MDKPAEPPAITLAQNLERHAAEREKRQVVTTVEADLRALERAVAALAGDPSLSLDEAARIACQ